MTGDPKRWLSDGEAEDSIERALLASVRDAAPPAGAKDDAWRAIAGVVAAGSVVASASSAAATSSMTTGGAVLASSLATKAMVVIAAGGIAASGYYAARSLSPEPKPAPRAAAVASATPAPEPAKVEVIEAAAQEERAAPEPVAPRVKRRDLLVEESALLTRARAALRSGDAAAAERMLQRMTAEFPRGVLEQERLVLAIEVLAARGKKAEAEARARRFAEAYPSSPHTARLRSLLDTP